MTLCSRFGRGKSTNAPGSKKNKRVGKARRRQARAGGGGGKRKSWIHWTPKKYNCRVYPSSNGFINYKGLRKTRLDSVDAQQHGNSSGDRSEDDEVQNPLVVKSSRQNNCPLFSWSFLFARSLFRDGVRFAAKFVSDHININEIMRIRSLYTL